MNYKLKKFEDKYAEEIRKYLGNDAESIARYLFAEYYNAYYDSFDTHIAFSIYRNVFNLAHNNLLKNHRKSEVDFYNDTIPGQISELEGITGDNIFTLVKYSFIKAYGKGWTDILSEYEEGTL